MKVIKLSNGQKALVDDEWYEYLSQWRWFPIGAGYASRQVTKNGVRHTIYMHRQVAGTPPGMDTDHINGDKLDNRSENLRIVSHSENLMARLKLDKRNNSGYRGVSKFKNKWRARVGRNVHLGVF
jgi:hypothetical protein